MAKRQRRTVFVIGSARLGGAEGQMTRLACELKAHGEDVTMLFLVADGPLTLRLDEAGVPWRVMRRDNWPPSSTARNLYGMLRLALNLARLRPDVVFAWLAGAVWPTMIFARLFTRARRVSGFRGEVFDRDLRWQAPLFRWAVRSSHLVTVNSPSLDAEAIRWGADPANLRFLPNGVCIPERHANVGVAPAVAVVVANFRWYKGHDTLVDALAHIKAPLHVRLCGEGETGKTDIAERARLRGVSSFLTFVEEPADVETELANAQFAIHPSRTEGLSNAILEELSYGLPVVATKAGGTPLLVDDGISGRLVEVGDVDAMATAMEELSNSPELRIRLSNGARLKGMTFGWPECTSRYLALLDELTAREGASV